MRIILPLLASVLIACLSPATQAQENDFFNALRAHCNKAYTGTLKRDWPTPSPDFAGKPAVMKLGYCDGNEIRIPLFIGDDLSRTWVLRKTKQGLHFFHIHRHADGSEDAVSRYGGMASIAYPNVVHFPVDDATRQMFAQLGLPDSLDNTWQLYLYPERFSYRLVRPGRIFQLDFDLSSPVEEPRQPW